MPLNTGMNVVSVRAGDNRVLTSHAHGYKNNEFVGKYLFPFASVLNRVGSVAKFDDAVFRTFSDQRAPGGPFNVIQTGYGNVGYKLENHGLAYEVPIEYQDEAEKINFNFGMMAQSALMNAETLNVEVEQAAIALNTANYGGLTAALSGTSQFSDPGCSPGQTVRTAMTSVATVCGRRPNLILAGQPVTDALVVNPTVRSQFVYTSAASITDEMLATYFGVDKYITAAGIKFNETTQATEFIWGKNMILAYTNPLALNNGMLPYVPVQGIDRLVQPAKFYTYVLNGQPTISNPFWDELRDTWFYKIKWERQHQVTGINSGYLLQTAVA